MGKRVILGLTAKVTISGKKEKTLMARVDTGATASSIDTTLAEALNLGPIIRSKIVKSASGIKKRPIIKAKININGALIEAEFTLADRSHMTYQILIGQNVLKEGNFIIDPHKEDN